MVVLNVNWQIEPKRHALQDLHQSASKKMLMDSQLRPGCFLKHCESAIEAKLVLNRKPNGDWINVSCTVRVP